jgi:hypothetical protein
MAGGRRPSHFIHLVSIEADTSQGAGGGRALKNCANNTEIRAESAVRAVLLHYYEIENKVLTRKS